MVDGGDGLLLSEGRVEPTPGSRRGGELLDPRVCGWSEELESAIASGMEASGVLDPADAKFVAMTVLVRVVGLMTGTAVDFSQCTLLTSKLTFKISRQSR